MTKQEICECGHKDFLTNRIEEIKMVIKKSKMGCKRKLLGCMRCGSIVNQDGRITKNIYRCMDCREKIIHMEIELWTLDYCLNELNKPK